MFKIITKEEYKPKYDLSQVEPFTYKATKNGHTNLVDFAKLVENNHVGKIAYWFDQKNKKNKDFLKGFDGFSYFDYEYDEFFSNAISICMKNNNTDVIEFLLFDTINKKSKKLQSSKFWTDYDQEYSSASPEYLMFLSKHNIIGGLYFENDVFSSKKHYDFLVEIISYADETQNNNIIKNLQKAMNNPAITQSSDVDIKPIKKDFQKICEIIEMNKNLDKKLSIKLSSQSNITNKI